MQREILLRFLQATQRDLLPERKKILPTWLEEVPSRRDRGIGSETEHPNLWDPTAKPQVKEALIRDLLRWCERQTDTGTAPFGACVADVPVDATIGSAQSRVNSRRRRLDLTEKDLFMTPTLIAGGPALERTARGPLHYSLRLPKWCSR